ncbi:MAG TPA: phytase [Cryptosporangiaceae bacterium]|nr:phytase [Cryptosporangiaceae bacterium]
MSKRVAQRPARVPHPRGPRVRRVTGWLLATAVATGLTAGPHTAPAPAQAASVSAVTATVETAPVAEYDYATMAPTVWVNPRDRARSLVIGTNVQGAVEVYDMAGRLRQRIPASMPFNIDVRGDLVAVTDVNAGSNGLVRFYTVDRTRLTLRSAGTVDTPLDEHGLCMYANRSTGVLYTFVTTTSGRVAQYALSRSRGGIIAARLVRGPWDVGGMTEGCAVDEARGVLYLAEEHSAIWAYGVAPNASTTARTQIDSSDNEWLYGDIEGLAVAGRWLIASSQGDSTFVVYDVVTRAVRRKFEVVTGPQMDGCSGTHGIEAVATALGPRFPRGVFVCQDGENSGPSSGHTNFKLVPLERVVP